MQKIINRTLVRDDLPILEALVRMEKLRRASEGEHYYSKTLSEFEQLYNGPEVGYVRRASNTVLKKALPQKGTALLDYGCGGSWWKGDYWHRFDRVDAVEIDEDALLDIKKKYPSVNCFITDNGLFDAPTLYDFCVSSSVVGYILPAQAKLHLEIIYGCLKKEGKLVLTRVNAFNCRSFFLGKLTNPADYSFAYAYRQSELLKICQQAGFKVLSYQRLGIDIPGVPWVIIQNLYKIFPTIMRDRLPRFFPFLTYQHHLVLIK